MRKIYDDTRPSILVLLAPIDRASLYLSLRGKRKIAEQGEGGKGKVGRRYESLRGNKILTKSTNAFLILLPWLPVHPSPPPPATSSGRAASSGTERRLSRELLTKYDISDFETRRPTPPPPPPPPPFVYFSSSSRARRGRGREDNRAKLAENRRHFRRPALPPG